MSSKCLRVLRRRFQSGEGQLAAIQFQEKAIRDLQRWEHDSKTMPWVPLMEAPCGPVSVVHINSQALARPPSQICCSNSSSAIAGASCGHGRL